MQLQSVKMTAEKFNVSERRVQKLCETGRIQGAQMVSNVWVIPDTAEKPIDERYSIELDDMVSLSDLCKELSISIATGRNWVKLGKLNPSAKIKRTPYFTRSYMSKLKTNIKNGDIMALKSRRNKKYISGNNIYNSYISDCSTNIPTIQKLMDIIELDNIEITDEILLALLADCAVKLILSKTDKSNNYSELANYLNGKYKENPYMFLVDDLLSNNSFFLSVVENYPKLFNLKYVFEVGEDILGLLYISLKNIGKRKATGLYYTPTAVVKKLCNRLFNMNNITTKIQMASHFADGKPFCYFAPFFLTVERMSSSFTRNFCNSSSVMKTCPSNTTVPSTPVFSFLCCDPNFPVFWSSSLVSTQYIKSSLHTPIQIKTS